MSLATSTCTGTTTDASQRLGMLSSFSLFLCHSVRSRGQQSTGFAHCGQCRSPRIVVPEVCVYWVPEFASRDHGCDSQGCFSFPLILVIIIGLLFSLIVAIGFLVCLLFVPACLPPVLLMAGA
mmetsp:Transcript_21128/g.48937  ORF Transcript_21128/g.48937 Transcript_21128/m.48937 type:complete len:123 (+) Transcript_21128:67-435(+)